MADYIFPDTSMLLFCEAEIAAELNTLPPSHAMNNRTACSRMAETRRLLTMLSQAQLCPFQLWCYPDRHHPFYVECVHDYLVPLHCQQGRDKGERMFHALRTGLETASRALLVICGSQTLSLAEYDAAIRALKTNKDIVLAPANGGRYAMIGMRQAHAGLFSGIDWKSDTVLTTTQQRIVQLALRLTRLDNKADVVAEASARQWNTALQQDIS